jgi:hypothetical protein
MSIKGNAEVIRDETATGANTAARVGSNLVEIADDLIDKNAQIAQNTSKVGYTDALVAAAPSVTTNGTNIATNATNIANNTTNISSNDTDIAANVANIAANTSGVASNLNSLSAKVNISSIVNDLTTGGAAVPLSAQQGVALKALIDSGGVVPINNLTSTSTTIPLAANQGRVLKGLVDGNTANITTNTSGVATNASGVATNVSNIATNTSGVATNTSGIATNVSNIATNTSGVATNVTNIATNTSGVATNVTNIATNTSGVATNVTNIATNVTNIATNTSGVATNVTNIATNTAAIATIGGSFTGGIWNGYTYQTVTSPTTGRVWLDRNLGAPQVATSSNDSNAYGFLYQFGRSDDGHQLRNSSTGSTKLNSVYSPNDLFIINNSIWANDFNYKVWQEDWEGEQLNSVAPKGFRLPTQTEFNNEIAGFTSNDTSGAFASFLKLPINKKRDYGNGSISTAAEAYLWCSDYVTVKFTSSSATFSSLAFGTGCGVRLILDN